MKRVDYRRVKSHRSYTYQQAARLLGVHERTVKGYRAKGLFVLTDQRPHLIPGKDLRAFVKKAKEADKKPCGAGELYCFSCRKPSSPAGDAVELIHDQNGLASNLTAHCHVCNSKMNQRASDRTIATFRRLYDVTERQAERTLREDQ